MLFYQGFVQLGFRVAPVRGMQTATAVMAKRKTYGYEEGHGEKNEVRKEKWSRKHFPPRGAAKWREANNLDVNVMIDGPVGRMPDFSYEDGTSGPLNRKQQLIRNDNLRIVREIHQAAHMVLKAREFERKD